MTFSLRRKRRTTPPAAPTRRARKITSALVVWLLFFSSAQAQTPNPDVITPKFVPAQPRTISGVIPAAHTYRAGHPVSAALPGTEMSGLSLVEGEDAYVRTELPGPQRLFRCDSE